MSKDYQLYIEFGEDDSPIDVFAGVLNMIRGIDEFNNSIAKALNSDIVVESSLIDISGGSVKIRLRDAIRDIPDDKLRQYVKEPRELLADLLIVAKHKIFGMPQLPSQIEKEEYIVCEVEKEISKSELSALGYSVDRDKILNAVNQISLGAKTINGGVSVVFDSQKIPVDKDFYYDASESYKENTRTYNFRDLAIIKKPDLIGHSKWGLRVKDKSIEAEILDVNWITKLKNREISIMAGDMFDADISATKIYDDRGEEISAKFFVLKIHAVKEPLSKSALEII